jgi:hypothetical protein
MVMHMYLMPGLVLVCLAVSANGRAGELNPPGAPAATMHSLEEIYDQVSQLNSAAGGGPAQFFFPHIIEQNGRITTSQNVFDMQIFMVYTPSFAHLGKDAPSPEVKFDPVTVSLYLYNQAGLPMQDGTGVDVANPATFTLSSAQPKVSVALDNLFINGFPSSVVTGFAVMTINSGHWNDVAVQGMLIFARTGPFDLTITPLEPVRIQTPPILPKEADTTPAAK